MDTNLTDQRPTVSCRRSSQPWLGVAGGVLIVACLIPPLSVLARRYLFVESIQFCVFAVAAPVLIACGAPWRLLPRGAARVAPRLAPRLVEARRSWASFAAALGYLIVWVVICLFWRLPSVLDGLARHPVLVAPEAVTLCAAGIGLWLELAPSGSAAPRRSRLERAVVAALAMWSLWVIAYVLGFASDSVVHAYDRAGGHLGTVADQEIAAFVLWAAAAVAFVPVVFTALLTWLKDGSEPAGEAGEPAAGAPDTDAGASGTAVRASGTRVRGWGPR